MDDTTDTTALARTLLDIPAHRTAAIEVLSATDGTAELTCPTPESLTNVIGSLHSSGLIAPRACPADHAGVAGPGTHICGVVVGRRRSASTPSSALQLHAPGPAHLH
jgi:hypothetical protein